jgi:hypothetical protein
MRNRALLAVMGLAVSVGLILKLHAQNQNAIGGNGNPIQFSSGSPGFPLTSNVNGGGYQITNLSGITLTALNATNSYGATGASGSNAAAYNVSQITSYNLMQLTPSNYVSDFYSMVAAPSENTGYCVATDSWRSTVLAGSNLNAAVTFTPSVSFNFLGYTYSYITPITALFTNGGFYTYYTLTMPTAVGPTETLKWVAIANTTGWSLWFTNSGSATAANVILKGGWIQQ